MLVNSRKLHLYEEFFPLNLDELGINPLKKKNISDALNCHHPEWCSMKENLIDFNSSVRPNRKKHLVDLINTSDD